MPDLPPVVGVDVQKASNAVRSFMDCLGNEPEFTYVSMPLTTGRHFTEWFRTVGAELYTSDRRRYDQLHQQQVIARNSDHGHQWVRDFRASRKSRGDTRPVMEPSRFVLEGLDQNGYLELWVDFIKRFAAEAVFIDGWQYSSGCSTEMVAAFEVNIPTYDESGSAISLSQAVNMVEKAARDLDDLRCMSTDRLRLVLSRLRNLDASQGRRPEIAQLPTDRAGALVKDQVLDSLAVSHNVAQFVSFGPDLRQRYSRILGDAPNESHGGLRSAVERLLSRSPDGSVNIRSFTAAQPRSNAFVYGVRSLDEAVAHVERLGGEDLITIVNETIDIGDGGVSGVAQHDFMEFLPGDTPRGVEKGDVARLSLDLGLRLLRQVYGFPIRLGDVSHRRVEFSIHPLRRGWRHEHTVLWESETYHGRPTSYRPSWPNPFSRLIGDKAFGLLVADLSGLPVPRTTVIGRDVAPFSFGTATGTGEPWLRTAPRVRQPGLLPTVYGWPDPFELVAKMGDGKGLMASLLHQEGVQPLFSGATVSIDDGQLIVQGKPGTGEAYMLGSTAYTVPPNVEAAVSDLYRQVHDIFGPAEFEWVFDGSRAWIVQLRANQTAPSNEWIVPGEPETWLDFHSDEGLAVLRKLLSSSKATQGVRVLGNPGRSSHVAHILQDAGRPSRFA